MYSQNSIELLTDRVGWADIQESADFPIELSFENLTKTSGRTFDSFNSLVLPDNVYYAVVEDFTEETRFNDFLFDVKKQNVISVLTKIMNQNDLYCDSFDYDKTIETKAHLFDEPIGLSVACQMIEMFISTTRKNFNERNAKFAFQNLKIELEGVRNENGYKVALGVKDRLNYSIRRASDIIFPRPIVVDSKKIW